MMVTTNTIPIGSVNLLMSNQWLAVAAVSYATLAVIYLAQYFDSEASLQFTAVSVSVVLVGSIAFTIGYLRNRRITQ